MSAASGRQQFPQRRPLLAAGLCGTEAGGKMSAVKVDDYKFKAHWYMVHRAGGSGGGITYLLLREEEGGIKRVLISYYSV